MSEKDKKGADVKTGNDEDGLTPPVEDAQLTKAKELGVTWKFGDAEYPLFLANKTGNIGIPIQSPVNQRQVAILGADFMWETAQVFLDHLALNTRDERNVREDETQRKRANLVAQNAKLFVETVQRGYLIKIDDGGDHSEPILKTRDEMLCYAPEIQSNLIDGWLGKVAIERFFPTGTDDIDILMVEPEAIWFTVKVGDYKKPAHILLMEFQVPSIEARRSYENDTFVAGSKQDGDKMVTNYFVNHKAKRDFALKHFRSVEGAVLGPDGAFDVDEKDLIFAPRFWDGDVENFKKFKSGLNANWWIAIADSLAGCFDFGGK